MWVSNVAGLGTGAYTSGSVYDASNRIANTPYDLAGNLLLVNANTLTYDAENRQTTVTAPAAFAGGTEQYAYDGNGRRVLKSGPSGATVYVYDAAGQLAAEYPTAAASSPCATCYLHTDHLGTTRLITDQNGNVVSRHDFAPFGEEIPANQVGRDAHFGPYNDTVNQQFTGKERDFESGLDYFGARYYGSALGRFTNPDWSSKPEPVPYADFSNPQSLNQYAYVLNNPLSKSDLDGHVAGVDDVVEAGAVVVLGTAAVITAWEETPAGQRSVSNLASAASDNFNSNLHALKDTVTSWFSPKVKEKTSEKAGGQCEYCGTDTVKAKKFESGVTPPSNEQQTDHYDPKSKGGKDDESNAANSCRTCNREKSDTPPKGTKWELPRFRKKPLPATASQTLP